MESSSRLVSLVLSHVVSFADLLVLKLLSVLLFEVLKLELKFELDVDLICQLPLFTSKIILDCISFLVSEVGFPGLNFILEGASLVCERVEKLLLSFDLSLDLIKLSFEFSLSGELLMNLVLG